jgi:hypothetical protein
MLGFHFLKTGPTQYVIHYERGRVRHRGPGDAFFYYRPSSTISVVPIGADSPFIFSEVSADFQPVTVQGELTYRVVDPELVASILDYRVDGAADYYVSDDPERLAQRLVNLAQVATRGEVQTRVLSEVIQSSDEIARSVLARIEGATSLNALGVEILSFSILAIRPEPETARAMEAEAREAFLRQADLAIYDRRNAAVEQERRIKENELNTELAVEEKQRQIRETQAEADLAVEIKRQQIRETSLEGEIRLENERKQFVEARAENSRSEADAQAYAMEASLRPLRELDDDTRELLAMQSAEPRLMVTRALKELAQNANKIGQLNISPDLLEALMQNGGKK